MRAFQDKLSLHKFENPVLRVYIRKLDIFICATIAYILPLVVALKDDMKIIFAKKQKNSDVTKMVT